MRFLSVADLAGPAAAPCLCRVPLPPPALRPSSLSRLDDVGRFPLKGLLLCYVGLLSAFVLVILGVLGLQLFKGVSLV